MSAAAIEGSRAAYNAFWAAVHGRGQRQSLTRMPTSGTTANRLQGYGLGDSMHCFLDAIVDGVMCETEAVQDHYWHTLQDMAYEISGTMLFPFLQGIFQGLRIILTADLATEGWRSIQLQLRTSLLNMQVVVMDACSTPMPGAGRKEVKAWQRKAVMLLKDMWTRARVAPFDMPLAEYFLGTMELYDDTHWCAPSELDFTLAQVDEHRADNRRRVITTHSATMYFPATAARRPQ